MTEFSDNTHRSLKRLVVVDAWFRRSEDDPRRFTLHADVSFDIERLGGGVETEVTFKIGIKRCEIVFVRPTSGFNVDRSSVRRQKPRPEQVIAQHKQKKASGGFRAKLGISPKPSLTVGVEAGNCASSDHMASSTYQKSSYNEQFTRSPEGYDAWKVDGEELGGCLLGPVFDVQQEPRLTLIDIRDVGKKLQDEANGMTPISRLEVRCMREDIDIHDIKLQSEDQEGLLRSKPGRNERMQIARNILREALLAEGLSVGHLLDNPYAEMTICDATIPILDQSS